MDILKIIKQRQSTRGPFDPDRPISETDLIQILEAARWAPTAHNMQNFEIIVVDDKQVLDSIANLRSPVSETFIRENYQQLSFSEDELLRKKVGLLGTNFPPAMRNPGLVSGKDTTEQWTSLQARIVHTSACLLVIVYDPIKRAPASEGDFLGVMSLGFMIENIWLTAHALGIGFQAISALSDDPVEQKIKDLLHITQNLRIAFSIRLGYPVRPSKYLRVRRDLQDFTHRNY